MSERAQLALMAHYNGWMNTRLYEAAARLPAAALLAERGAFFGSVMGTLNHLVVADTLWLKRFATHPAGYAALDVMHAVAMPAGVTDILSNELAVLGAQRSMLDAVIVAWVDQLAEPDLDHVLHYTNTRGIVSNRRFGSVLSHFFNHQTHHRGQASTLLSQAGVDIGVTDLLALVPEC